MAAVSSCIKMIKLHAGDVLALPVTPFFCVESVVQEELMQFVFLGSGWS